MLIKIHIPVKGVQLKMIKGKISKTQTHYNFSFRKINRNENRCLTQICTGECLHLNSPGIPYAIFQCYHSGLLQIPVDITFFSRVLKFDKLKGCFNRSREI